MAVLEPRLGIKLFAAPMMASGIIFFSPPSPPDPTGFLVGTAGAATVAAASLTAASYLGLGAPVGAGAAAGALLMWYKATGTIFPPAAVLCMLMASAVASAPAGGAAGWGWKFVVTPWVSGHAFLWASAFAVGGVRGAVRCAFVSCVCAHGRLGLHFHAHTLSHTLSHKHTHTHTHRHTHTRTRTHAHTHTHTYTRRPRTGMSWASSRCGRWEHRRRSESRRPSTSMIRPRTAPSTPSNSRSLYMHINIDAY